MRAPIPLPDFYYETHAMPTSGSGIGLMLSQQPNAGRPASILPVQLGEDQFGGYGPDTGETRPHPCLFNFQHLRSFLAVCELGSIKRASDHTHRLKSAVTRSIHEIERALGVALFEREADGIEHNAYGEVVRYRAERALREFSAGLNAIAGRPSARKTSLDFPISLFHEKRLRALVAMTETDDLSKAAKMLSVTPRGIIRSINDLERNLDMILFTHTPQGRVPTRSAQTFSSHVKRTFFELEQIRTELAALGQARVLT